MVCLAVKIRDDEQTKTFSAHQFRVIMHATNLVAVYEFWQALQRLAGPDQEIRIRGEGILAELVRFSFESCAGVAFSPEHAAVFVRFGLTPIRIARPGEYASC